MTQPPLPLPPPEPTPANSPGAAPDTAGLVLAGGEGRRMGGRDKGLVPFLGTPLALHGARRLAQQVGTVMISANRHLDVYRSFGYPVVQDTLPGFNGPLAGVLAGLEGLAARHDPAEFLLVVPCDTPAFPADLAIRLRERLCANAAAVALAEAGGRRHYACLLLRTCLRTKLAGYLAAGGRSIRGWFDTEGATAAYAVAPTIVAFAEAKAFANLNEPAAVESGEKAQKSAENT